MERSLAARRVRRCLAAAHLRGGFAEARLHESHHHRSRDDECIRLPDLGIRADRDRDHEMDGTRWPKGFRRFVCEWDQCHRDGANGCTPPEEFRPAAVGSD